jgi:uncharacterized protein
MAARVTALGVGVAAGFVIAWARLSDPTVIRDMLLLREAHVFLIMGSAIVVAAVGVRALRAAGFRALITGEPIAWTTQRPEPRHVLGAALFGTGWSLAGTCPGPLAAMVGSGNVAALFVAAGLVVGIRLQPHLVRSYRRTTHRVPELAGSIGL